MMLLWNVTLAVQSTERMAEGSSSEERKGDSCDWPYQVGIL